MNNYCTNCGKKLEKNALCCPSCGTAVVNDKSNKKPYKKVKLIIFGFLIFCAILAITIPYGIRLNEKISIKKIEKKIIDNEMKKLYKSAYIGSEFIKKEACLESYNTCAGDSGSGRQAVKDCDVYFFKVNLNNGIHSMAYVLKKDGNAKFYDEVKYTKALKEIEDYVKDNYYNYISVYPIYYTTEDSINSDTLDDAIKEKVFLIDMHHNFKKTFNYQMFKDLFNLRIELSDKIENDYPQFKVNDIVFKFDDNYTVSGGKISNHLDQNINDYNLYRHRSLSFEIDKDASLEEFEWCIKNSAYSHSYDDYLREKGSE